MKKLVLLAIASLQLLLFTVSLAPALANQTSPLGINTNEAIEVDSSLPFVDLFRFAMPFESARPWLTKGKIDYDKNGWPRRLNGGQAGTRFLNNIPAKALPRGTYTVRYEGKGRLRYGGSAKLIKRLRGRDLIRLEPKPGGVITATLFILKSDPKNYVRNIRVLMSGGICKNNPFQRVSSAKRCKRKSYKAFADHYDDITFNPDYLNFMKDFKVIRFMNMAGITRNPLRKWKNRPNLKEATWGGPEGERGVPLEIMVKLANQLNINPWFNMPHNADDNFLQRFASYVKRYLKPDLNVYIEYTNEAWNAVFVPQAEHMKQNGTIQKLDTDRRLAGFKYYSKQSVHVFKQWEAVFGDTSRLVRVMGGMTTDTAMSEIILAYQGAFQYTDALALAPYFYIDQDKLGSIRNTDAVFSSLGAADNRYSIDSLLKVIRSQAEQASAYGVNLIAYEGGQHLVDHKTHKMTEGATPHLVAANRDPRMAKEYRRLLEGWKDLGGKLFVAFSSPRPATWHGSWGIKEYINQPDAKTPKYRALMTFNADEPCWWKGCKKNQLDNLPKPKFLPEHLVTGEAVVAKQPKSVMIKRNDKSLNSDKENPQRIENLLNGTLSSNEDLSAEWRASWSEQYFNLSVTVWDDQLMEDSDQPWADDSIEIYIDADGSRQDKFDGKDDFHLFFSMKDQAVSLSGGSPQRTLDSIRHKMVETNEGYRLDMNIPWQLINVKPQVGLKMGFDVHVNDDDNGNLRDAKMTWNAAIDQAWKNPSLFGEVVIAE